EPRVAGLTPAARQALADHFTRIALMEHASIAAFARFSLELLALGAPADLVEASNAAMVDETRHARLGFSLASHYAGVPVGPGALDLDGALDGRTTEDFLRTLVLEGCIGETRAALEASHALSTCKDPIVAEILAEIAEDEARHAELAWRTLQWLLAERPALRKVVEQTLQDALAAVAQAPSVAHGDLPNAGLAHELAAHRLLPAELQDALHSEVLREVVEPCVKAVFAALPASAAQTAAPRSGALAA